MTEPQQGFAIGVDLGTSNTVAVIRWPDGRTRPLLVDGAPIMSSGVFVDEHGRLHVGRDAARLAGLDPSRFEPNPKRRIDEPTVLLGDREIPTVDLLAAILAAVARAAVEAVGFLPTAVLTYPAAWGTLRRDTLATAARRAGWPPAMLVPEPVAAARYFADVLRRPVPVGSSLAVFDFGGGTFDVAVVRNDNGRFTVIGSSGVEDLGGLDIDAALVEHLGLLIGTSAPETWAALRNPATMTQRRDRRLFWDDVRGAKEMLSRTTVAPIAVPGHDQAIHLTREELDRVADALIRRAVWETASTVKAAGLRPDELAGLFLVGGSSRLPLAARLLHSELGVPPIVLEQPELPVAEGALAELAPVAPAAPMTGTVGIPAHPNSGMFGVAPPAAPVSPAFAAAPTSATPVSPPGVAPPGFPTAAGQAPPGFPAGGQGPPGFPAGGQAGPGFPMSAAQAVPPNRPAGPPTGDFLAVPAAPPRRRRGLLAGAVAAVVALALVAGAGWWFFLRDRPATVDFATLKSEKSFQMAAADTIDMTESATLGDRAYIGWKVKDKFYVQGLDLDGMKVAWPAISIDRDYSKWSVSAYPDGVVVAGTGSSLGSIFVLSPADGKVLWQGTYDTYDRFYALGPVFVVHRYKEKETIAFDWKGQEAWKRADQQDGSFLVAHSRPGDLRGPADFTGTSTERETKARDNLLSVDGDDKIRLVNARTGQDIRSWNNTAGASDHYVAHNNTLFVAGYGTKYIVKSFDLTTEGEPAQLFSAPDDKVRIVEGSLTPCGQDRVCFIDGVSGGDTNTVRAISVADKKALWTGAAPGSTKLVPVGANVLATDYTGTPASALFSATGKQLLKNDDKKSTGVRVTGGSMLFFTGTLSGTSSTNPALVGVTAANGDRIALGSLTETIGLSCSWNDTYILCAQKGKYQVWRFAA